MSMENRFYIVAKNVYGENKDEFDDSETATSLSDAKDLLNTMLKMGEVGTILTCEYYDADTYEYCVLYKRRYKNILGKMTLIYRGYK